MAHHQQKINHYQEREEKASNTYYLVKTAFYLNLRQKKLHSQQHGQEHSGKHQSLRKAVAQTYHDSSQQH
jgi:hypothetical protein